MEKRNMIIHQKRFGKKLFSKVCKEKQRGIYLGMVQLLLLSKDKILRSISIE